MRTTAGGQSVLLLLDVVDILNRRGVPYVVVGAIAAACHGVVRASRDADAVVSLPSENLPALAEDLKNEGFQVKLSKGAMDDPIGAVIIATDAHGNKVDLLWGVRGMEVGVLERCRPSMLLGASVRIIGAEDFIAMKLFAGSPKDLEDVRGVLEVSGDKLDVPLLKKLTRRYGVEESRTLASLLKKYLKPQA